ncbi:MAG: Ig-like domain-containing protein, partial [Actinobacteria bacterium]|nr:Ig-like domain-containing protein [Actinomycetota bacterium]
TDVFSNVFLFYTLAINHPQPSPIIDSLIPANGSIVSRIVKLGVYPNNDMAENPLISSVDVLVDNDLVETIMFPPFEYNWDTSVWPNQYHTIEYRAYDVLGRYYPLSINVKVENSENQTSTDSFHDSIIPFWGLMPGPYKEYSFEMARDGLVNVMLSGENVRYLTFALYDKEGERAANSKYGLENPKSLNLYLKAGKYFIRVMQSWHASSMDKLIYSLTINHPSANLSILRNLSVLPKIIDPSEDNEIEPMTFSYDLLEDAYVLVKLTDFNQNLIKLIQPLNFQSAGIYNIPNIWNGLLENEKISDEGIYFFVIELYDKDKNFLEKQSDETNHRNTARAFILFVLSVMEEFF